MGNMVEVFSRCVDERIFTYSANCTYLIAFSLLIIHTSSVMLQHDQYVCVDATSHNSEFH